MRNGSLAAAQVNPIAGDVFLTTATMVAFIFVAFLNQLITGDLRRALDDATHNLQEANRRLAQASDMKSQFTARTSHELRTPLSSIIAFTDLALRDSYGPLAPKLRDALTYVFNSSRHLKDIINDLLDLSKIEAGQLQMADEVVSLPKLVESVVGVAAPMAAEKGLKWSIAVSPDMPHEFRGDKSRLEQILLNLTGNALKYTEKGSVSMSIDRVGSDRWRVEVRDSGVGIPEDQFESIFEAYRQLNGTTSPSKVKGTGLGLAITRHLVRLMGGTIRVREHAWQGVDVHGRAAAEGQRLGRVSLHTPDHKPPLTGRLRFRRIGPDRRLRHLSGRPPFPTMPPASPPHPDAAASGSGSIPCSRASRRCRSDRSTAACSPPHQSARPADPRG